LLLYTVRRRRRRSKPMLGTALRHKA